LFLTKNAWVSLKFSPSDCGVTLCPNSSRAFGSEPEVQSEIFEFWSGGESNVLFMENNTTFFEEKNNNTFQ